MVIKQKVYLSLGSNVGNRHANLQKAIFRIQQRVGSILGISSVYENPAIGFEGDDFLNIAISLLTPLHPKELLENLLQIEQDFGRVLQDMAEFFESGPRYGRISGPFAF